MWAAATKPGRFPHEAPLPDKGAMCCSRADRSHVLTTTLPSSHRSLTQGEGGGQKGRHGQDDHRDDPNAHPRDPGGALLPQRCPGTGGRNLSWYPGGGGPARGSRVVRLEARGAQSSVCQLHMLLWLGKILPDQELCRRSGGLLLDGCQQLGEWKFFPTGIEVPGRGGGTPSLPPSHRS